MADVSVLSVTPAVLILKKKKSLGDIAKQIKKPSNYFVPQPEDWRKGMNS